MCTQPVRCTAGVGGCNEWTCQICKHLTCARAIRIAARVQLTNELIRAACNRTQPCEMAMRLLFLPPLRPFRRFPYRTFPLHSLAFSFSLAPSLVFRRPSRNRDNYGLAGSTKRYLRSIAVILIIAEQRFVHGSRSGPDRGFRVAIPPERFIYSRLRSGSVNINNDELQDSRLLRGFCRARLPRIALMRLGARNGQVNRRVPCATNCNLILHSFLALSSASGASRFGKSAF